jgi:hypothetical protein
LNFIHASGLDISVLGRAFDLVQSVRNYVELEDLTFASEAGKHSDENWEEGFEEKCSVSSDLTHGEERPQQRHLGVSMEG